MINFLQFGDSCENRSKEDLMREVIPRCEVKDIRGTSVRLEKPEGGTIVMDLSLLPDGIKEGDMVEVTIRREVESVELM